MKDESKTYNDDIIDTLEEDLPMVEDDQIQGALNCDDNFIRNSTAVKLFEKKSPNRRNLSYTTYKRSQTILSS